MGRGARPIDSRGAGNRWDKKGQEGPGWSRRGACPESLGGGPAVLFPKPLLPHLLFLHEMSSHEVFKFSDE